MLEYYYIKGKCQDIAALENGNIEPCDMKLLIIGESIIPIREAITNLSDVEIYSLQPSPFLITKPKT